MRIDQESGLPASSSSKNVIVEAFRLGTEQRVGRENLGENTNFDSKPILSEGVGGLY